MRVANTPNEFADGESAPPRDGTALVHGRSRLKTILVAADLTAVSLSYLLALLVTGYTRHHGWIATGWVLAAVPVAGCWSLQSQGLFLARISAVRVVEITRAIRAIAILGGIILLSDRFFTFELRFRMVATASVISLVAFTISRSCFRAWLTSSRSLGRHCRRVLLIGTDVEAVRLVNLLRTHPEMGVVPVGVIGARQSAIENGLDDLWLGDEADAERLIALSNVSGVVVSPHSMGTQRLNGLLRHLQRSAVHVFISTGFSGIDARRVRSLSMAHEPMLYVESPSLGRTHAVAKRAFDIAAAGLAIAIASPIMLVVAIGIKLGDRGPVFFRQRRVGRNGQTFELLKFRTMVVDAERQLALLDAANERRGPLFKMVNDPRVTKIGRFLRESSLDELPQLFNVLTGGMSLVGPRPALPSEVEQFSVEIRTRERVTPGITGLWQVEARDNPSFEAYCRLDLFYVENWSLTLDLLIIISTIEHVVARMISTTIKRRNQHLAPGPQAIGGSHVIAIAAAESTTDIG